MRTVWMIPLAYVAGIEGFGWFVPYLLFVCAVATFERMRKTRALRFATGLAGPLAGRLSRTNGSQASPLNESGRRPLELESTPA